MLLRNSILIGAAAAGLIAIGFGASVSVSVADASPMKERALKSAPRAAHDDISVASEDGSAPTSYNVDGTASWYGGSFDGRLDARGERFDSHAMTAAHRTLPFNSLVRVTNLANGLHVLVRITDRGPYAHRRVIDLSRAAADALGYVDDGTARVNVRAVSSR
jgi:rare lipoprotein A